MAARVQCYLLLTEAVRGVLKIRETSPKMTPGPMSLMKVSLFLPCPITKTSHIPCSIIYICVALVPSLIMYYSGIN